MHLHPLDLTLGFRFDVHSVESSRIPFIPQLIQKRKRERKKFDTHFTSTSIINEMTIEEANVDHLHVL